MSDTNKVLFQEEDFNGWMEESIADHSAGGSIGLGQAVPPSRPELLSAVDLPPKAEEVHQPEPVPVVEPTAAPSEPASQERPKPRKRVPLRIEDLNLHEWIHGTGEEVTPDEEEEQEHLGL